MTQQATQIQQYDRQQQIILGLMKHQTHEQIARDIGVSRSTIERDIRAFANDKAALYQWFTEQWIQKYSEVSNINPIECLHALTQLLKRSNEVTVTQNNIIGYEVTFCDTTKKPVVGCADDSAHANDSE